MKQLKIAEGVGAYVEHALSLPFTVYCNVIPDGDEDGACVRHDPTPAAERRFTDGTRLVSYNLTFYTRCRSDEDAREWGKRIVDELDGATIESPDGIRVDCEAVTLPQYIDIDSKGFTTYAESVRCTYLEE